MKFQCTVFSCLSTEIQQLIEQLSKTILVESSKIFCIYSLALLGSFVIIISSHRAIGHIRPLGSLRPFKGIRD